MPLLDLKAMDHDSRVNGRHLIDCVYNDLQILSDDVDHLCSHMIGDLLANPYYISFLFVNTDFFHSIHLPRALVPFWIFDNVERHDG